MRLSQAFRAFFRILRDPEFAAQVDRLLLPAPAPEEPSAAPAKAQRSEALTLLAVLQREGRFVDFLQEPIDSYSDAQIGAASREVHRGCRDAIHRIFALKPAWAAEEGSKVRVEKGYDPARVTLTGQVSGEAPYEGTLMHPGWEATRCDLPEWSGHPASVRLVAPAEVELK